jgi:hypothetical protein
LVRFEFPQSGARYAHPLRIRQCTADRIACTRDGGFCGPETAKRATTGQPNVDISRVILTDSTTKIGVLFEQRADILRPTRDSRFAITYEHVGGVAVTRSAASNFNPRGAPAQHTESRCDRLLRLHDRRKYRGDGRLSLRNQMERRQAIVVQQQHT